MSRRIKAVLIACALLATVALAACGGGSDTQTASKSTAAAEPDQKQLTIYFVGVASPQDPFHGIINRGAQQAGKDLGAKVVYIFPDKLTVPNYNQKFEEALAAKPDGVVILGLDEKASEPIAKRAREQGVVLGFNPAPSLKEHPLWTPDDLYTSRVGSDEYSAGVTVGREMANAGVKGTVACPIFIPGDPTLASRCQGVKDTLKDRGIQTDVFPVDQDPGRSSGQLVAYLGRHSDVGGIVALGGAIHGAIREALQRTNRANVLEAAFDLNPEILDSIKKGETLFTIDQQPFWRGYIPVMEIVHKIRYGLQQANYFLSGPSIVDKSNVNQVEALAKQGLR